MKIYLNLDLLTLRANKCHQSTGSFATQTDLHNCDSTIFQCIFTLPSHIGATWILQFLLSAINETPDEVKQCKKLENIAIKRNISVDKSVQSGPAPLNQNCQLV